MAAVAASQAGFAVMHLTQYEAVDTVATPVSSYALTWPGIVLFPFSVLSLAFACAILAGRGVGLAREGFLRFLLGATAVMLVAAAVCRTGVPERGLNFTEQVHRYSAGAAFVFLTVVAGLCAARMKDAEVPDWVRRATWAVTAVAALMFATTTVNTFLPAVAGGGDWRGIPQRVLLVALSGLVWVLVANSSRATTAPRPATPEVVPEPALKIAPVPALEPTTEIAPQPALAGARS